MPFELEARFSGIDPEAEMLAGDVIEGTVGDAPEG
jgi:hypothetical protein